MSIFNITIPGFTIACKSFGDKNLPPMLALHGWLDNANSFDNLAPYLEDKFYFIAVDLPGHGLSSHLPLGCNYHFMEGIINVIQIIQALGIENVHLLGHSMGACLASLVAGVIPEKIASLTLIEAIGPFSSPEESARAQMAHFAFHELTKGIKKAKPYESFELASQARAQSGHLPLEFARILCHRGVIEKEGKFYWRHDRRLVAPSLLRMTEGQVISCLEAISAKTCLILAEKGFAFNPADLENRIRTVQHLVVYRIAGGHHLHMEKPDALALRLAEFYSSL